MPQILELDTPHGPARVHLHAADRPRGALVLGHGAGGGVTARDLVAVSKVALAEAVSVALVEQPYRVAGRRSPPRAPQLDGDWTTVCRQLAGGPLAGLPLVTGGRSSGARVACRTAQACGAVAVLCLAFPLVPPARAGKPPPPSRAPELGAVAVPVLVVQGARDRFGVPEPGPNRRVAVVDGDHRLASDLGAVAAAAQTWIAEILATCETADG